MDGDQAMTDNTCYIERSAVREMILSHPNWLASSLLGLVDGLKIFVTDDFRAQPQSPAVRYVRTLEDLIQCLIDNDPDEPISDAGHTVIDQWRKDAERVLSVTRPLRPQSEPDTSQDRGTQ
jgi:hypothetical protein